jgi:uncharacterized protein with beta-barrel porin domain
MNAQNMQSFAVKGMHCASCASWRHAFGDVTPTSTFAFAGGDALQLPACLSQRTAR